MSSSATVVATPEEPPSAGNAELFRWQRRLLPMMTRFIVVLAGAFFCFSAVHLYQVSRFIEIDHGSDIRALIEKQVSRPAGQPVGAEEVLQDSLLLLEADTLDKRYHQANAQLLSRIWSRQLAFITGMVMAFLGAIFILGKLTETTTSFSGGFSQWQVGLSSASPGIILSCLGTVLLVTSLLVQSTLDVTDGPAYVTALGRPVVSTTPPNSAGSDNPQVKPFDITEIQKPPDKRQAAPPK